MPSTMVLTEEDIPQEEKEDPPAPCNFPGCPLGAGRHKHRRPEQKACKDALSTVAGGVPLSQVFSLKRSHINNHEYQRSVVDAGLEHVVDDTYGSLTWSLTHEEHSELLQCKRDKHLEEQTCKVSIACC
jgi:hypothetical protein